MNTLRERSRRSEQKGIALFLTLIFILILSVLGVSIIFVSQSETWSGLNYLEMTQARYGAEAGLNAAANYIVNTYCAPGNTTCTNGNAPYATDTLSLYNTNVSPVTLVSTGATVTLSTVSGASTYPVTNVVNAFASAAAGSVSDGNRSVNYTAVATLVAMNSVTTAAGTQTVQTWDLVGTGTTGDIRAATVTVDGIVEQQVTFAAVSAPSYGVFATGTTCDAITLSGGATTNSYNSKNATSFTLLNYGGDIGTNGNLTSSGGATVNGTLSSPRTGVSTSGCSSGDVDAWNYSGGATVTECGTSTTGCGTSPVKLSTNVTYTTPTMPTTPAAGTGTNVSITSVSVCGTTGANNIGVASSGCTGTAGHLTLSVNLGNVSVSGGGIVTLTGTSYGNLTVSGGGSMTVAPTSAPTYATSPTGTPTYGAVAVSGGGTLTLVTPSTASSATYNMTSLNLSGGDSMTLQNSIPVTLNISGTAGVTLSGGAAMEFSNTAATPGVVTMNIAPTSTNPWNGSGGTFSNVNSHNVPTPIYFQINYGGTSGLTVSGGAGAAGAFYAPSAPITMSGGATWYGSLIGSKITDSGGAAIYYDQNMGSTSSSSSIATVQQFMMDSFSWTRF